MSSQRSLRPIHGGALPGNRRESKVKNTVDIFATESREPAVSFCEAATCFSGSRFYGTFNEYYSALVEIHVSSLYIFLRVLFFTTVSFVHVFLARHFGLCLHAVFPPTFPVSQKDRQICLVRCACANLFLLNTLFLRGRPRAGRTNLHASERDEGECCQSADGRGYKEHI